MGWYCRNFPSSQMSGVLVYSCGRCTRTEGPLTHQLYVTYNNKFMNMHKHACSLHSMILLTTLFCPHLSLSLSFSLSLSHTHSLSHTAFWWGIREPWRWYCDGPSWRLPGQHLWYHVPLLGDGAKWETRLSSAQGPTGQDIRYDMLYYISVEWGRKRGKERKCGRREGGRERGREREREGEREGEREEQIYVQSNIH